MGGPRKKSARGVGGTANARGSLRVPPDLRAFRFRLASEDFALISFDPRGAERTAVRLDALSPSQRQIAELAAKGWSNAKIANARATSIRTVENQIADVYRKLGLRSRRGLAALGLAANGGGPHG
jgi:DNA-binding NarL/FixJ family response regulator